MNMNINTQDRIMNINEKVNPPDNKRTKTYQKQKKRKLENNDVNSSYMYYPNSHHHHVYHNPSNPLYMEKECNENLRTTNDSVLSIAAAAKTRTITTKTASNNSLESITTYNDSKRNKNENVDSIFCNDVNTNDMCESNIDTHKSYSLHNSQIEKPNLVEQFDFNCLNDIKNTSTKKNKSYNSKGTTNNTTSRRKHSNQHQCSRNNLDLDITKYINYGSGEYKGNNDAPPLTKFFSKVPSHSQKQDCSSEKQKQKQGEMYKSKGKKGVRVGGKKEQMYLDFGQKSLGARVSCDTCGLYYVKGDIEDETMHRQFCKKMSKIPSFPLSLFQQQTQSAIKSINSKIIGGNKTQVDGKDTIKSHSSSSSSALRLVHEDFNLERKIIEIRQSDYYSSSKSKLGYNKFTEIKGLMDADMDYATEKKEVDYLSDGKKAYMAVDNEGQIMACAIVKPLQEAWEIPMYELEKDSDPMCLNLDSITCTHDTPFSGPTSLPKKDFEEVTIESPTLYHGRPKKTQDIEIDKKEKRNEEREGKAAAVVVVAAGKEEKGGREKKLQLDQDPANDCGYDYDLNINISHSIKDTYVSSRKVKAYIGINQMWVHPSFRRKGICSKLLDIIRVKFFFNFVVEKKYLAFSQLTSQGKSFVKRYLGDNLDQSDLIKQKYEGGETLKTVKKIGILLY